MATKEFFERLSKSAENLTRINHYSAFLLQTIYNEIYQLNLPAPTSHGKYEYHPLPLKHSDFPHFPVNIDQTDSTYERELDELAKWVRKGGSAADYRARRRKHLADKKSYLVKKILSCAEDFAQVVKNISENNDLPISSLTKIITTITFDVQGVHPQARSTEQDIRKATPNLYILANNILVPEAVPLERRDRFILDISKKLYSLFQESFWLLLIVGMADFLNTLIFVKYNSLDNIKKYLLNGAVFAELEDRIQGITRSEDLYTHLNEELAFFGLIFPNFSKMCMRYIGYSAAKKWIFRQTPIGPTIDSEAISWKATYLEIEEMHESLCEAIDNNTRAPSHYSAADTQKHYFEDAERNEDSDITSEQRGKIRRKRGRTREAIAFDEELTHITVERLLYEPLKSYHLQGGPAYLVKYIRTIIENRGSDMIAEHHNEIVKEKLGICSKTRQRYKKVLNDVDNPDAVAAMRKKKEASQKHEKEGYVTLNKLAATLSKMHKEFQARGIPLKKYSESALKSKIKMLLADGVISADWDKKNKTYYFKITDVDKIARAIA